MPLPDDLSSAAIRALRGVIFLISSPELEEKTWTTN
jgi:hypothetical protein